MKKIACIAMAALLSTSLLTGVAVAKPHGGGSPGKSAKSSVHSVVRSEAHSKTRNSNLVEKKLKKQVREKVKAVVKNKNREKIRQIIREKVKKQNQSKVQVKEFKDVKKHWAKDSIKRMQMLGIVGGYEDGTFKPENGVTEAEAIAILMRLFEEDNPVSSEETLTAQNNNDQLTNENEEESINELENDTSNEGAADEEENEAELDDNTLKENDEETVDVEEDLNDVPGWAKETVKEAAKKKIINLNRFHSHVQATRAQIAVWIAKSMELEPVDTSDMPFKDGILISAEDAGYIMALVKEGLIKGTPDGRFNPNSAITRAELAVILDRVLQEQIEESEDSNSSDQTNDTALDENTENNSDSTADNNDEELVNEENLTETEEESNAEDSSAETETANQ